MRYPSPHKFETRTRLVRATASLAKKEGFAATGVDALARSAGLTSGALYKHFAGKDALLAAICDTELEATRERFAAIEPGSEPSDESERRVLRVVDAYLSMSHVRATAEGCVIPALSAEIARAPLTTREVFEHAFTELVSTVAQKLTDQAVASALVTQCVGALTVARALATETAQREVLSAARAAVRSMLFT